MRKSLHFFWFLLLSMVLGASNAWGAENDEHNFAQSLEQLLNNNASISSINIAEQTYRIKKVIVSYRYNKTLTNAVTVSVSVGGDSWGDLNVVGTGKEYATLEFTGSETIGAVTISFTNNAGNGTGKGTFYVNNIQLVEGASTAPSQTYTITLGDDSSSLTEESAGTGVTLPSRSDIGGYTFAGWSETNVDSETTTLPNIIPAGNYTPTANITLYPVYTKTEGGATPTAFSVGDTGNYAIVSELSAGEYYALPTKPTVNNGKITAQKITVSELDNVKYVIPVNASGFTWTIAAATNGYTISDGSHYIYHSNGGASGTNLAYGDLTTYTWSFTADEGYIKMAGMSGSTTNNRGLLFSSTTIGGYALSNWGSYDKTMILPIANAGTTYYWSAPVAAAVESPEIVVAENPFMFSTTATITCETEGATIYYSYDNSTWTKYTTALTITEAKTIYAKAVKDANESSVASVEVAKNLATPTVTVSGDLTVDLNGEKDVESGTLTATVTYNESAVEGATVTWSSSKPDVATIDENTGVVTIKTRGNVTFTATYAGNSDYAGATDKKEITVIDSKAPGSQANPYKVSDIKAIENGVYVQGIISSITEVSTQYHNATYKISEDGTTTNEFTVFRGKYLDNANFTSAEQISIGDAVVIYGNIDTYQEQLQLGQGNYLVSLKRKPTAPTFSVAEGEYASTQTVELTAVEGATIYYTLDGTEPTNESTAYNVALVIDETTTVKAIAVKDEMTSDVATATYTITLTPFIAVAEAAIEAEAAGKNGTIEVTYNNFAEVVASVVFCDAEGNDASYDWFSATINENKNVSYSISANAVTEARTGYVKVKVGDVYSDIITITQAAFVIDYAELPFGYNGGKDNLPVGLTEFGLGSNYNSSTAPNTQLKFDGNGDSLILKINEAATVLSFDIKGNSFSGGTFTVQTSANGVDYIDLETYTELSESQETFVLDENIRYIKWVYTEKKSGNVGLGNIKVQKHLGNATVTLASACNDGDGKYYGTYSNAAGFVVPADLTVAEVGIDGELIVNEYATGDIVAANTGVMVSSETAGDHNIVLSTGGTSLPSVDNRLRATGNEGITAKAMNTADDDCVFYRLTMHNGTDLGFYWGADDGAAFAVAANKAYLAVPKATAARIQGFSFDGGTITGINNLTPAFTQGEGVIFDLQGRSVANPAKGLYIKNGKKVVVK